MDAADWVRLQQASSQEHPASGWRPLGRMDGVDSAQLQQAWSRRDRQASGWRPLDRMEAVDGAASQQACRER
jgi:hypothetical protein